jgi:hypothetical protein
MKAQEHIKARSTGYLPSIGEGDWVIKHNNRWLNRCVDIEPDDDYI